MKQDTRMNLMDRQPDKLFREKLEAHQLEAPDTAWARIADGLESKHGSYSWLRVAAVVLPLAFAAGYFLLRPTHSATDRTIAKTSDSPAPSPAPANVTIAPENSAAVAEVKKKQHQATITRIRQNDTNSAKVRVVTSEEKVEQPIVADVITSQAPDGNDVLSESSRDQNAVAATETGSNAAVIHISIDESLQYLDKNYREQATSPDAKSSRLQKLVDFASDIKDPVGEIRQFKQDLLAFNFKNEKKDQTK